MNFIISEREMNALRRLSIRQLISQAVAASYAIIHTYIIWMAICVYLNNDSPIVCVLSESMEPGFKRGDILFLRPQVYKNGDICVYQLEKGTIPIVHRVIQKKGSRLLTKGDNNRRDDRGLYKPGKMYLEANETRAGVFGYIPYFGMPTIWISSVPGLKQILLIISAYYVFIKREDDKVDGS